MNIPKQAIPYILYQRTGFLSICKTPRPLRRFVDWLEKPPFYRAYVSVDAFLRANSIKNEFAETIGREFSEVESYLPPRARTILDIGCGVGGIDVFLAKKYPDAEITLFDETRTDQKIHYGFENNASFYNSLSVAKELVEKNGGLHVATWPVSDGFPKKNFDLIVSYVSWGIHYPIDMYLDKVYNSLNSGGVLITDVRNGTGGLELIKDRFGSVKIISQNRKSTKIAAQKV